MVNGRCLILKLLDLGGVVHPVVLLGKFNRSHRDRGDQNRQFVSDAFLYKYINVFASYPAGEDEIYSQFVLLDSNRL
jgi:hypothetical protein